MRNLLKTVAPLSCAVALLTIWARPAFAHIIRTATVTASCTSYTITVTGTSLEGPDTVKYTITFTPTSGSPTTVQGSIAVFPDDSAGDFSATQTNSVGPLSGDFTLSGSATLVTNNTIPITFTSTTLSCPARCTTGLQPITYNLHESSSNASEIVWFNSHFKLQGTVPSSDFTVFVVNGTIQFGSLTLAVPNGQILFSSKVSCASTTFNGGGWQVTVPLADATKADEIFAAGLAFVLPANFAQNVQGVTWTADFSSTAPSLDLQWQWGAANYLSNKNGFVFPMSGGQPDYNAMMVKPAHNAPTCAGFNNGDHAGTPESTVVKALVTGGGSGGGGSNWTGSWSSTQSLVCK